MPLPPDWPRAGGYGPAGSDRPMIENLVVEGLLPSSFGRRELTDEDLLRVVEVAREVSPQWGDAIEARRAEDPAQLRSSLRASGRRLLGLVALKERAPRVFAAKIAELRAQAETERVAGELRRAESERRESDVADAALDRRIEELGARLEQAAAAQVQATLAARGAELVALDERLAALKKELASDESGSDRLADEIVERAREGRPDRREPRQGDR